MRVCVRTWRRADSHRIDLAAASVAYFALLSTFPGLAAIVAVYGWLRHPEEVTHQIRGFEGVAPPEALALALEQMQRLAAAPSEALALSAILGFALSIWALNRGITGFRGAMIALDERRGRSRLLHQTLRSLVLTLSAILAAVAVTALLAILPAALAMLPLNPRLSFVLEWARWPVLLAGAISYAAILYRWGVNRSARAWAVVLPAATAASSAWLAMSMGLTAYLARFAALSEVYGSLAGAVVLLLWLYLTAYVFLLGAELSFVVEDWRLARRSAAQAEPANADTPASSQDEPAVR